MYVVTVEIDVRPQHTAAFQAAMIANAQTSRTCEPGCRQFDVAADPARADCFFLYERYDDRAAFDAHLASTHFKAFDRMSIDWIGRKAVRFWTRLDPC